MPVPEAYAPALFNRGSARLSGVGIAQFESLLPVLVSRSVLTDTIRIALRLVKHTYVGSEHLLLALASEDEFELTSPARSGCRGRS